jgi:hypothetical protein
MAVSNRYQGGSSFDPAGIHLRATAFAETWGNLLDYRRRQAASHGDKETKKRIAARLRSMTLFKMEEDRRRSCDSAQYRQPNRRLRNLQAKNGRERPDGR